MAGLTVATWNVNSVRARKERLLAWLARRAPDVVLLQETKVTDELFPLDELRAAGYEALLHGQKTYNGVAILSRHPLHDVVRGLAPGEEAGAADPQARFIAATILGVRLASVYVPNGQIPASEKFAYKLRFLETLRRTLATRAAPDAPFLLGGDFNVAPEERDVHDPVAWSDSVLFHPDARTALARLGETGLVDALRLVSQEAGIYSWWDYRMLSFPKNRGLRIDHLLVSTPLASRCQAVTVDRDERKGTGASDHAPVLATFRD